MFCYQFWLLATFMLGSGSHTFTQREPGQGKSVLSQAFSVSCMTGMLRGGDHGCSVGIEGDWDVSSNLKYGQDSQIANPSFSTYFLLFYLMSVKKILSSYFVLGTGGQRQGKGALSQPAQAVTTEYHKPFSHSSRSWKSKIRGLAQSSSDKHPLPGLQTIAISQGVHVTCPQCIPVERESKLSGVSSYKGIYSITWTPSS